MKERPRKGSPDSGAKPATLYELRVTVPEAHGDLVSALVIRAGGGGVVEEPRGHDVRLVTYGDRARLLELAEYLEGVLGSFATVEVRRSPKRLASWETKWTKELEAVRVSPSLVVAPEGTDARETPTDTVVRLHRAATFGFGEHPTTRMAARAVELAARAGKAKTLFDFGSGSGVLALVFVCTGGASAVGVDVDARAVAGSRKNARLNRVSKRVRFERTPLSRVREVFDVVVANVDRGTLLREAKRLSARVASGGTLLLTGFLRSDVRDVLRAYSSEGFRRTRASATEGDWALLALSRGTTRRAAAPRARRVTARKARRTSRTPRSR